MCHGWSRHYNLFFEVKCKDKFQYRTKNVEVSLARTSSYGCVTPNSTLTPCPTLNPKGFPRQGCVAFILTLGAETPSGYAHGKGLRWMGKQLELSLTKAFGGLTDMLIPPYRDSSVQKPQGFWTLVLLIIARFAQPELTFTLHHLFFDRTF